MFNTSTQREHWLFTRPEELDKKREDANRQAAKNLLESRKVAHANALLAPKEELWIVRSYLVNLKEFCRKFTPPMRKSVIATAFMYMKRFYLRESVMDHAPLAIGVTCAYLACKVDEFNVTIDQFLKNVKGDCKKAQKIILSNELLLMKKLRFHLTVHLPYRAVEGFMIDLRARYPQACSNGEQKMAEEIEDFLDKSMFTDACFLYTPSQIALTAVCCAAEKCNIDLTNYLTNTLFVNDSRALDYFKAASEHMRSLIESDLESSPGKDTIKKVERKLSELPL